MADVAERILVACALKKEARGLRQHWRREWRLTVTGLGADRTVRALDAELDRQRPELLIFTGMAGQLDPGLTLGEFCFPRSWLTESGTEFSTPSVWVERLAAKGWKIDGRGVTTRIPVVKAADRLELHRRFQASICDLESAAAMMVAAAHGVPCLAPKLISDTADSGMLAFYRRFDENIEVLADFIERLLEAAEACLEAAAVQGGTLNDPVLD
jgi:nucleoside phosphorylase